MHGRTKVLDCFFWKKETNKKDRPDKKHALQDGNAFDSFLCFFSFVSVRLGWLLKSGSNGTKHGMIDTGKLFRDVVFVFSLNFFFEF